MPDWLASALGIGGGVGSAVGGIFNLANPGKNPADEASRTLGQIPGQTKEYYDPYINAGRGALETGQNEYNSLIRDPNAKLDQFGAGYKQSPGYKYNLEQALYGTNNAAAAGGTLGTLGHQQLNAETSAGIASQDYDKYIQHIMELYGIGTAGNQEINKQGQQASGDYADLIANIGQQQADLQFKGQDAQNREKSSDWSNVWSGLGTALGTFAGGPAGAAVGGWLGKKFG